MIFLDQRQSTLFQTKNFTGYCKTANSMIFLIQRQSDYFKQRTSQATVKLKLGDK
uniref:Uncharacterized protein n=1 Tax=Arion vulgaris TaxID=1028688 RepID=A0A0B7A7Q0_9EUPU